MSVTDLGGAALFGESSERQIGDKVSMKDAPMGTRTSSGRYKMPLLPGESGPKAGGDWVPGGLQSMTNLAASISDTKALGSYEREQSQIGLVLRPDLAEELSLTVNLARVEGVDFTRMKNYPALRKKLEYIHDQCKDASGANGARQAGINRHTAWEHLSKFGNEIGTPQINKENAAMRALLDAAGFEIVPELTERTVRNTTVNAAGRFDNIVMCRGTGKMYMADLKTKRGPFWSFLEIDAQLAGYASSEFMLEFEIPPHEYEGSAPEIVRYVDGPLRHVDQEWGVVLHMPSDGSEPRLRRADLKTGLAALRLAREVCTMRSYGKSAEREAESYWPVP